MKTEDLAKTFREWADHIEEMAREHGVRFEDFQSGGYFETAVIHGGEVVGTIRITKK